MLSSASLLDRLGLFSRIARQHRKRDDRCDSHRGFTSLDHYWSLPQTSPSNDRWKPVRRASAIAI
ncbi:hypothetical protein HETIRDRAFT_384640 [Heterobasidion irregulare TC 32-1]|uniref:Uncharacterized protein n=1 Tax=Heterobasidion irregulare (strain TC 32-1) TaxID=747525 RepID=W4KAY4_HETIT|nr:uncharacterized protein HETIRDRAFT_384640 [Heterobasidion irregulare TC 32-1]ETW82231.1 hypothetical protein HETIRDRAFT_384640 [Heterobasidion irregulare TC 32-1]